METDPGAGVTRPEPKPNRRAKPKANASKPKFNSLPTAFHCFSTCLPYRMIVTCPVRGAPGEPDGTLYPGMLPGLAENRATARLALLTRGPASRDISSLFLPFLADNSRSLPRG